jgi:hypothetical protein
MRPPLSSSRSAWGARPTEGPIAAKTRGFAILERAGGARLPSRVARPPNTGRTFCRAALARGLLVVALPVASACSTIAFEEPTQDPFEVQVNVTSDPGLGLPGAELLSGTRVVAKTDAAGTAKVRFAGKDGDQVEIAVRCPADYESPATPLLIALRRLAPGSQAPRFEARCSPTLRTVVVGLRVEKGPNLPVMYLGRTVARTDASGAALFSTKVKPSEQVAVTLSTAEKGAEQLRPQNPILTFVAKDYDDFVVLEQSFTIEKKPVHYQRPKPSNRPTPLETSQ